jgi:hypothetical protein
VHIKTVEELYQKLFVFGILTRNCVAPEVLDVAEKYDVKDFVRCVVVWI